MSVFADRAVVLLRYDYSETSQVVALMTRDHGVVRAIAKGIKRGTKTRFATGIDLLDVGRVVLSSRREKRDKLATVTEWKQTQSLNGLRDKLFRIHAAQYAAEITGHLIEDWDPHPALFDHLLAALTELAEADEPLATIVRYQRGLLSEIGSLPRFEACVACGRGENLTHFSSREGGMICRDCEASQIEKHGVTAETLRRVQEKTIDPPLAGAFSLLNYHLSHLMGRESRLAPKLVPRTRRQNGQ